MHFRYRCSVVAGVALGTFATQVSLALFWATLTRAPPAATAPRHPQQHHAGCTLPAAPTAAGLLAGPGTATPEPTEGAAEEQRGDASAAATLRPLLLQHEPTQQPGGDALQQKRAFLQETCCLRPPCPVEALFDFWCFDSNRSCPVFPEGQGGCAKLKGCVPRWVTIDNPGDEGGAAAAKAMPFHTATLCIHAFLHFAAPVLLKGPGMLLNYTGPAGEDVSLTPADFPIGVSRTKHMCHRPCNKAWPCAGKHGSGGSGYARDPCWKHFYTTGKHFRLRQHHSLMAIWCPPVVDQISALLIRRHGYDPKLHASIRRSLDRKPGLVVDVGSNLGVVSLFATRMGHRVVAFDPTPWTRHKLHISLWLNRLTDTVRVVPAGVGSRRGTAHLAMVPGNLGGNQIVSDEASLKGNASARVGKGVPGQRGTVAVDIVTLDDVLEEERDILFIKIDVEGQEIEVVKGAQKVIAKHHPVMIIETCYWCSPDVLFALLQGMGYVCGRDEHIIDRTMSAVPGHWPWDVETVLQPHHRSQLRPNVICIHDPDEAQKPFDTGVSRDPASMRQWQAYRVEA